jgi:signal transduction histidine kinase/ActR/RegA family two-component response regulator
MLSAADLSLGSGAIALIVLAGVSAVAAAFAGWLGRTIARERSARSAAELAAAQSHRLAQTTAALANARTSADAMATALHEPLHWLRAAAAVFYLVGDDRRHITAACVIGYTLDREAWQIDEWGDGSPFSESQRRLSPIVIRSASSRPAAFNAWSAAGPWRGHEASLVLPIAIDRQVMAFIQIDFDAPREFSSDDNEYIHMLCARAAQTLQRTWWFEAVERARVDAESLKERADVELAERQKTEVALRASETRYRALATRTTRLHALTAGLSEAASVVAVTRAIVEQAPIVVGANQGDLKLLETDSGEFGPGLCATDALQKRTPVFAGSLEDLQEKYWSSASFAADRGFASSAALPLLVKGEPLGVLEFHFSAPVNFDDDYRALLISVAQHCTQALDRARLYEQAERARSEAVAANKLKDEFVSTVSHELRTPLNAILGWASMLRMGSVDAGIVPQAVEAIHRNASRQAKLVDDLLDFGRIAGGKTALHLEPIEAAPFLRGIVESIIPLATSSQIDIQLTAIPDATLMGDVRRLEQIFTNLLGNSLKFTQPGGRINVSARTSGRNLEVRVADDGIGIAPDFLPYVFDRFRQGDGTSTRNHSGLGLGLSIAKQLVDAHNGSIRAESAGTGKGTAFIVTLPVSSHEESGVQVSAAAEPGAEPRLDGVRVLVVDDEVDSRELIGRALEDRGALITLASNSRDALLILDRTDIDVLLADIAMPGDDGYSLIRQIRSAGTNVSSIPAGAVTAHARDEERSRALAAGFQMHLAKPVEPADIVRMVDHLAHDRGVNSRLGV